MQASARNQFWMVGVLVLSCIWLYANETGRTGSLVPIREVSVFEARELMDTRKPVVLDVREKDAFDKGHIPGAVAVPIGELPQRISSLGLTKADPVLVYCGDGSNRGPEATAQLKASGYEGAVNLKGGFSGWQSAGQPVAR